jgi:hypothetical protein
MMMVTVYRFKKFDMTAGEYRVSALRATREAIEKKFGAVIVEGSAEEIDSKLLHDHGLEKKVCRTQKPGLN